MQPAPAKVLTLKPSQRRTGLHLPLSIWASLLVLCLFIICALFADWLAPYDPVTNNLRVRLAAPVGMPNAQPEFLLGTDALGRDLLSRLLYGARVITAYAGWLPGQYRLWHRSKR